MKSTFGIVVDAFIHIVLSIAILVAVWSDDWEQAQAWTLILILDHLFDWRRDERKARRMGSGSSTER